MKVSILNYNCGNITSINSALNYIGASVDIVQTPNDLKNVTRLIIPGVGAFGFGMVQLMTQKGLLDALQEVAIHKRIPILGICLGAQLMLEESDESPGQKGMQWVKGSVKRVPSSSIFKVPHVGWSLTKTERPYLTFEKGENKVFYYTHSYHMDVKNSDLIVATCSSGHPFVAAFKDQNILGCQFHPEKSQKDGLIFLENFLKI